MKSFSAELFCAQRLDVSLNKIVFSGLIAAFLFLVIPFVFYATVRIGYAPAIDYNEGFNVVHTSRFLSGEPLYLPVTDFPLTPVNYPPLSFLIIGGFSYFTGSILITGRVVALVSLLVVSYLIFKTVDNFTSEKHAALVAALLWLALVVHAAGHYVGMDDPQLLAHVFSVGALCLYSRWIDNLSAQKLCVLAFLCCIALFIKHLLIAVPISLAVALFITNRRAFWTFALAGIVICAAMLFGSWSYGGEHLFSNFLDLNRPVSLDQFIGFMTTIFLDRFGCVFFVPYVVLLFLSSKRWLSVLVYFPVSFVLGAYACRGIGVDFNAWFDFFIATAMMFGLFAVHTSDMREVFGPFGTNDRIIPRHWLTPVAVCLILFGVLTNEFIVPRLLVSHAFLQDLITSNMRLLQAILLLSGLTLLLAGRQIAANLKPIRLLLFYAILTSSLLPFSSSRSTDVEQVFRHDQLDRLEKTYQQDVQLLRAIPGPALFEDALLGFDSGKKYLLDPFNTAQNMVNGRIPEQLLTSRIRDKYFSVIVLNLGTQKTLPKLRTLYLDSVKPKTTIRERWTDNTLQAITANYELVNLKRPSRYFFYVPRNSAS